MAVYTAFVVYGSLVPLDYRPIPLDEAWQRFQRTPYLTLGVGSRADWIANGVLYLPLGALLVLWLRRAAWPAWLAAAVSIALGAALAFAVEFAQLFFPPRTVSQNDLIAEVIGLTLGAFAGLWLFRRGEAIRIPLQAGRAWLGAHGFAVYAALYVAYSLFPYDLLLSAEELSHKLDSDLWGWWLAGSGARPLIVVLLLGVEAALALPLGLWLARRTGARLGLAVACGLMLGLALEAAQMLIATGTSQGASVLARALGVAAGAVAWHRRASWHADGLRRRIAAHVWLAGAAYALLLVAVNGWFGGAWRGFDAAQAKWSTLRLLPLYYHYYTSEAQALVSLASVALMYAPVGVLAWARGARAAMVAVAAAVLALAVETAKLFLAGQRPDPTNVMIAAAAAAGVVVLLRWALQPPTAAVSPQPAPTPVASRARGPSVPAPWPLVAAGLLFAHAWTAPALALLSTTVVIAAAAAAWWRPVLAPALALALLPAFDLAPWTGRGLWDEYDVLLAACVAAAHARTPPRAGRRTDAPWAPLFALLVLSFALSTLRTLLGEHGAGAQALAGLHDPFNAVRIAKGVVWAALLIGLLRRVDAAGLDAWRAVVAGMCAGLAWVVAFVVWERVTFVGLFDFADAYRTTGPFSAMHRGGAYIECYLALATPFAAAWLVSARHVPARVLAALLLAGAGYAMFVTYSRNGYAAMAVALVAWLALAWRRGGAPWPGWRLALAPALVAVAAAPVLMGSYAQERLATWQRDLAVRHAHWADALAIRDTGVLTALVGMGVGSFPLHHYWRSGEPALAATYHLGDDADGPFLRFGGGAPTYLDQVVGVPADGAVVVSLELRAARPRETLAVSVCEKWMLTSRRCVGAELRGGEAGRWSRAEAALDLAPLVARDAPLPRPVKFSLHSPARGVVVDVADVRLTTSHGSELLANGDFADGLDRWLSSTDSPAPYQTDSAAVGVLFDQGWLGAVAWSLLLAAALVRGVALAWQGNASAAVAVAALLAFVASATLNTLIDEPRFLMLLLVLAWCAMAVFGGTGARAEVPARPRGRGRAGAGAARQSRVVNSCSRGTRAVPRPRPG